MDQLSLSIIYRAKRAVSKPLFLTFITVSVFFRQSRQIEYKTVIFVHGCFRHQHEGCKKANRPTSNVEFWNMKLDRNIERDKNTVEALKDLGWKVVIVWQCELKDVEKLTERLIADLSK